MQIQSALSAQDTSSNNTSIASASSANKAMGKQEFLMLLTEQLKHQDPMNPMDNTAFVAQLAQFSSLEQSIQMNESLKNMVSAQNAQSRQNTFALIGKTATVHSDNIVIDPAGKTPPITFDCSKPIDRGVIQILDEKGNLTRSMTIEHLSSGVQSVDWNGKDLNGNVIAKGRYHVQISAVDKEGNELPVNTRYTDKVSAVEIEGDDVYVMVGQSRVKSSDLARVE